jgi:hypothetical protein
VSNYYANIGGIPVTGGGGLVYVSLGEDIVTYNTFSTQDGSYNDLDISTSIPAAVATNQYPIKVRIAVSHATLGRSFSIRPNGATNAEATWVTTPGGATTYFNFNQIITDTSGIIEYRVSASGTTCSLQIIGYWTTPS